MTMTKMAAGGMFSITTPQRVSLFINAEKVMLYFFFKKKDPTNHSWFQNFHFLQMKVILKFRVSCRFIRLASYLFLRSLLEIFHFFRNQNHCQHRTQINMHYGYQNTAHLYMMALIIAKSKTSSSAIYSVSKPSSLSQSVSRHFQATGCYYVNRSR